MLGNGYTSPILMLIGASIIFWFKGNAKVVFGWEWTPFKWWLSIGLLTDFLTLSAWWSLIALSNVWRAGVMWGVISLVTDLILNSYFFGFNWKGVIALLLCMLAAVIVHS